GKPNRVIGITSALPHEGKSTIIAALALLMSQAGARTILVDCDLRNPSLTRRLAPKSTQGLLHVIFGKASLSEVVYTDWSTGLSFLPAVLNSRFAHTNEIVASDAMKKLIESLRESYDYVLVDLSPLAPVVDVRATTHLFDSYVFVIEWARTGIDVVEQALNDARGVYENLLGVVLNKSYFDVLGRFDGYGGYFMRYY